MSLFEVLPLTDDNDVLNMADELPRNHSDSKFGTEPNIETNVESGTDPNDEPIGRDTTSRSKPNVETNAESRTDPNDEPIGSDTGSGSEPNVETNDESGTDPNDEPIGSDTECESCFEEDDFSIDEEDVSETESIFHTPQFTEYTSQFETHFKETRVVSDNETEYSDSLHSVVMIFANREVLKKAVINYSLRNRLHLKFKRNDLRRVNVISKPGCPLTLWASRYNPTVADDLTWQIKTLKNEHSCNKDYGKINISSRTIAEKYLHFFVSDMNFSIHSLHEALKKYFISLVHQSKLYRARDITIGIIEGNHKDQFSRIYDYLGELRLSNLGTTTICKLDERVFERLYICMQACKDGFKAGCRPIICLDGCHLKGYHGGHMLTTVGIDTNDCIYPIAFVVVESECHSSWCWFVQLLGEDLDLNNSYHISFMSDRQKVLCKTLYNNVKGKHKGKALKDSFWKAATSTYMREFQVALAEMESLSPKAFEWLKM
ncbi:hypothetical protein GQ457_08G016530 [Hibiscus cannabinus]